MPRDLCGRLIDWWFRPGRPAPGEACGSADSWPVVSLAAVLVTLLIADGAMMLVHLLVLLARYPGWITGGEYFQIDVDRGMPEAAQYFKFLAAAGALVVAAWRWRGAAYLAWALLVTSLFIDDAFKGHEQLGNQVARALSGDDPRASVAGGARLQDWGELLAVVILYLIPLVAAAVFSLRGSRASRQWALRLAVCVAIMAAAGVGVDAIHALAEPGLGYWAGRLLGLVEDGGEMVAASLLAVTAVASAASCPPDDRAGEDRL